jgi:4-hydroxymandelate oxidase
MNEQPWNRSYARRAALRRLAAFLGAAPLLAGQQDPFRDHSRVPRLDELLTAFDFEPVAFANLPRLAYDYTAYGVEGEFTLRRNRDAFAWVDLIPRGSTASQADTSLELFGKRLNFPILVAPTAGHAQLHPDAESATYAGATKAAKTTMIVSNVASMTVPKIAAAAKGNLWWQLYPRPDLDDSRSLLDTAQANGAQAIVVTIDQQAPYYERALHDRNLGQRTQTSGRIRVGAAPNPYRVVTNRMWYTWSYFDSIRPMIKVPLLAKGVLTAEGAALCVEHGLDGIVVSNHGGRGMDYSPSTLEVLPEIVAAVRGRIPVLIDSGFRSGDDILKALALGAKAVCLGRVPRWGLGAFGAEGVERVLRIMQQELAQSMSRNGCPSIASIDRKLVRTDFR